MEADAQTDIDGGARAGCLPAFSRRWRPMPTTSVMSVIDATIASRAPAQRPSPGAQRSAEKLTPSAVPAARAHRDEQGSTPVDALGNPVALLADAKARRHRSGCAASRRGRAATPSSATRRYNSDALVEISRATRAHHARHSAESQPQATARDRLRPLLRAAISSSASSTP